ncbi:MAG: N-acetylmuramic acid 6-phosphate etherase [Candidatus Acidiferrum sp.]
MSRTDLHTEQQNQASAALDTMSSLDLVKLMNQQDASVIGVIREVLPAVARAVDIIAERMSSGGRLIYVGSGTSGRIGALDASECPPTFGTDPSKVQYIIAGGDHALAHASEASEDSAELGLKDMAVKVPGANDVVVGIAASGRTPYTLAALDYARRQGSATIALACNRGSALAAAAHIAIEMEVGPEVLTGSTRLKAGTAQKLICNMLTTGAMTRIGYVYGNLMVNLQLKNEKLVERGISIVESIAGVSRELALETLKAAEMRVPVAIVMLRAGTTRAGALRQLQAVNGNLRRALESRQK